MHEAYACLRTNGLDGAGEALRILVNEASCIERAQHLRAAPYQRSAQCVDHANGYKPRRSRPAWAKSPLRTAGDASAAFTPALQSAAL